MDDFLKFLDDTWSWQMLTPDMRGDFLKNVTSCVSCKAITGAYWQRWYTLQAMYDLYLCGCGHCPDRFAVGVPA